MPQSRWEVHLSILTGENPERMADPLFWKRILGQYFLFEGPDSLEEVISSRDAPLSQPEIESLAGEPWNYPLEEPDEG